MAVPSIKGSAFQGVVEDLLRLREAGTLDGDTLEAALEAEDLQLLEQKVLPGLWYPLTSYRRFTELLMQAEGDGSSAYVVARGARAAERLFAAGLYQQLSRGDEIGAEKQAANERWSPQEANLMTSVAGAIFNVSRWRFVTDEAAETSRIEVTEALFWARVSQAHGTRSFAGSDLGQVASRRP